MQDICLFTFCSFSEHFIEYGAIHFVLDWVYPYQHTINFKELLLHFIYEGIVVNGRFGNETVLLKFLKNWSEPIVF